MEVGSKTQLVETSVQLHSRVLVFCHSVVGAVKQTSDLGPIPVGIPRPYLYYSSALKGLGLVAPEGWSACWCKSTSLAYLLYRLRLQV